MDNKRVLAVLPHPDDIEILCAGTLVRLIALGYAVHFATMTAGDKGSAVLSPNAISAIRRAEAKAGAAVLGAASYRCLEYPDLEINFDNQTRYEITGLIREINPFLVFTTPPFDYMTDHVVTGELVRDACFNAGCRNYDPASGPAIASVPYLYYTDAVGGTDRFGSPTPVSCTVDISAQIELKTQALKCHDSQRAWLQKQHGMDNYIDSMRTWSAKRGAEIGVDYAEAFIQHCGHPYPHDDFLALHLPVQIPEPIVESPEVIIDVATAQ